METIVTIDSECKIDSYSMFNSYLLVNKNFSCFHFHGLSNQKCIDLIDKIHSLNKKVYILLDRVMFDENIYKVKRYVKELINHNIDGYFISDLGLIELFKEIGLIGKVFYYSQTQIVSQMELDAFGSLNLKGVFVSKDYNLDHALKISNKYPAGINVFGYRNLFYSKRQLLSAYKAEFDEKGKFYHSDKYLIKEKKREIRNPIFENKYGTYIFTHEPLSLLNRYKEIKNSNIKYILFDDNLIECVSFIDAIKPFFNLKEGDLNE